MEDNGAGYWVDNTANALAEGIERILSLDEIDYKSMRVNSYKLVSEKFDVEQNVNKWIEAYKKVLNEK